MDLSRKVSFSTIQRLTIASCIALQSLGVGQQPYWRLAQDTRGIDIAAIDIFRKDPDTMFAIGSSGGEPDKFLKSSNAGLAWKIVSGPGSDVGAIKIDPTNSNHIYVSHWGRVFDSNDISVTTDGGVTWVGLFSGRSTPAPVVELDPANPSIVYVGVGPSTIKRSTDNGTTWTDLAPVPDRGLVSLSISKHNSSVLYAGYSSGVYKSYNHGGLWQQVIAVGGIAACDPIDSNTVYAALFGQSQYGIFRSQDGGIHWAWEGNGLPPNEMNIQTVAIDSKMPGNIYLGMASTDNNLIYRSTDAGCSWHVFSRGLPDSGHVTSIVIDTVFERVYAGVSASGGSGIYVYDPLQSAMGEEQNAGTQILCGSSPNPFRLTTNISFVTKTQGEAELAIFDLIGRRVKLLFKGEVATGYHAISYNAADLSSGIYFCRIQFADQFRIIRMVLMR